MLGRIKHDGAHGFSHAGATGLACLHQCNAMLLDACAQACQQGAFACAFAAFETDEFPARGRHRQCFRW
jgi:hypothetical protein